MQCQHLLEKYNNIKFEDINRELEFSSEEKMIIIKRILKQHYINNTNHLYSEHYTCKKINEINNFSTEFDAQTLLISIMQYYVQMIDGTECIDINGTYFCRSHIDNADVNLALNLKVHEKIPTFPEIQSEKVSFLKKIFNYIFIL